MSSQHSFHSKSTIRQLQSICPDTELHSDSLQGPELTKPAEPILLSHKRLKSGANIFPVSMQGLQGLIPQPPQDKVLQPNRALTPHACAQVLADPESPETWSKYALDKAAVVVWCAIDRSPVDMAHFLKQHRVPLLAVSNSNQLAIELYDELCTYVVQQVCVGCCGVCVCVYVCV